MDSVTAVLVRLLAAFAGVGMISEWADLLFTRLYFACAYLMLRCYVTSQKHNFLNSQTLPRYCLLRLDLSVSKDS